MSRRGTGAHDGPGRQVGFEKFEGTVDPLDRLSESEAAAYRACVRGDLTVKEWAESTGRKPSTGRTLLHRARKKLGEVDE